MREIKSDKRSEKLFYHIACHHDIRILLDPLTGRFAKPSRKQEQPLTRPTPQKRRRDLTPPVHPPEDSTATHATPPAPQFKGLRKGWFEKL